ncbi:MAG: hypothetical protein U0235_02600 [Polyangiaceae bacterium]
MGHRFWLGPLVLVVLVGCSGGKELPDFGAPLTSAEPRTPDAVPVTMIDKPKVDVDGDAGARPTVTPPVVDAGETVPSGAEVSPGIFTRDVVARGFALAYGRTPDIGVWASWINKIDGQKFPRISFLHELVMAPEFPTHFAGLTDGQYAVEVYQRFLHRAPSGDEIHNVSFLLSFGFTRAQIADRLVGCPDFALATNPEHPYFF